MSGKVRHTVFLWFNPEVATPEKIAALEQAAQSLKAVEGISEGLVSYDAGQDLKLLPDQPDFVISGDFVSQEAYQTYAKHPAHLEMIANFIKPLLAKPPVRAQIVLKD